MEVFLQHLFELATPVNLFLFLLLVLLFIYIHKTVYRSKIQSLQSFFDNKMQVFKNVLYVSEDVILILSDKYEILYANTAAIDLFSLQKFFKSTTIKLPKIQIKNNYIPIEELIVETRQRSEKRINVFNDTKLLLNDNSKETIPVNFYFNTIYIDIYDKVPGTILVISDLRKKKEKEMLGYHHQLTGLPNQIQALSDLHILYAKLPAKEKKIALVLMDIDNFSTLRSIIGYEQSNVILVKFANYLKTLADELSFSVYNTVHNNFLLLMPHIKTEKNVLSIVKNIQKELKSFYKMENSNLHLTASVGISTYPDRSNALSLLDDTYKALTNAEKSGHGRIEIFQPQTSRHEYDALKLYNDMHQALDKNEFEVYYQPIVDASNREIVSAEALIRWHHPEHGMIMPDSFIPLMEKTGFIIELGKYVLEEVLKQQKRWELFKFKQISVSINLSMLELESGKFVEYVLQQLKHHQVAPELIKFEVTEGMAMLSEEQTRRQLNDIRKLGIDISLDDFGTGYTSFTYLKKIPANILKIDRSLVMNIVKNEEDQRIVHAMIELGHNIGMKIVVEGIEDEKMFDMLVKCGSDFMQGYYFSKPVPVFEFQKMLR